MTEQVAFEPLREEPMRFTAEEFLELAQQSPLADVVGKIELVDGVIVHMSPAQNPHAYYQSIVFMRLARVYEVSDGEWMPLVELSVRLNGYTVRDPDIAVVRNPKGKTGVGKPEEVLMVVEIAHTTLKTDLGVKRRNYARAGVPHYWVVDVAGRQTHIFSALTDGDYGLSDKFAFGHPMQVPETGQTITID